MTKYKISAREAAVIGVHTARYIVKSRRSWSDLFCFAGLPDA